ncbi:MAG: hypothetical protein DRJ42_31410, partial [Deltaproteobacteria bacterium]
VQPSSISADLEFLASELMAGRNTPSPELELAANYLLSRVQRMGLQPGAAGRWFQEYPLERTRMSTESRLWIEVGDVRLEHEPLTGYLLFDRSRGTFAREGACVGIGDGSKPTLAALPEGTLEGLWAVARQRPEHLQSVRRRLQKSGAVGLLILSEETREDEKDESSLTATTRKALDGNVSLALPAKIGGDDAPVAKSRRRKREPFPILGLRPGATARLFAEFGSPDCAPGVSLELRVHAERVVDTETLHVRNLCALLPGSDPGRAADVILCSAHYDHVGVRRGETYPGADDNASGTAGLLALAEASVARGPLDRSVLFVWLSGEEKGLWGSKAYCQDPPLGPGLRVVANLNIDMIGRTRAEDLYITPSADHEAFNPFAGLVYELAPAEGFGPLISQDEFYSASDHYNFAKLLEVPVVFLSTGDHPDYHKPTDTVDKLDVSKIARVVRLGLRVLDATPALEFARAEATR